MTDPLWFIWAAAWALILAYSPGVVLARALGIAWRASVAIAPAVTAGVFGIGAIVAAFLKIPWNLASALLVTALVGIALWALRRGIERSQRSTLPGDGLEVHRSVVPAGRSRPLLTGGFASVGILVVASAVAVLPILGSFGSPGQPLQRWDALFHLSALQWIRETGYGSTRRFASLSTTDKSGGIYPAAFHDIAALVPLAPTPIVLNAATLALALVPWIYGTMFLARMMWHRLSWGPLAAGIAAAIAPAVPLSEWIHLAAIPNLVATAFLPGVLGVLVAGIRALRFRIAGSRSEKVIPLVIAVLLGSAGLGLMHPNVFIAMCLMIAAAASVGAIQQRRQRPQLARFSVLLVLLALIPVFLIVQLPGAGVAGDFVGGLAISPVRAVGELASGLLTVWAMATGPLLWLLGYLGIWALLRRGSAMLPVVLLVPLALYMDAAIDSPLRLSALWYSGQDRISMLLTLVVCLLVVPGLAHLNRELQRVEQPAHHLVRILGVTACVLLVASTISPRMEYAERNLDLDRTGRARYFDSEEYTMLQQVGATMDTDKVLLASPFSGGAHLYGMTGQSVRYPAAGMRTSSRDDQLMDDVLAAPGDPAACARLIEANIGYVYADRRPYNVGGDFTRLDQASPELGEVIGSTDHSIMLRIDCETE